MLKVSILILTYNRPDELIKTVESLETLNLENTEVIVVDNASEEPAKDVLKSYPFVSVITLENNIGVGARNVAIKKAAGDIVITLDDDVRGITKDGIGRIINEFSKDPKLAALNFKVLEEGTGKQINWCHHRKVEDWGDKAFDTYEISEGAVALRREAVISVGLYPENYFISHEGPDLAIRLMNLGGVVRYEPKISVNHARSEVARVSWRRYYYDSRNLIWFVYKYFGWRRGILKIFIAVGALFFYSIRDGYIKYWFKALKDACLELPKCKSEKLMISDDAWCRYDEIKVHNPSVIYLLRKRIFNRDVSI
jgi:GT2 family glycosyltransferase